MEPPQGPQRDNTQRLQERHHAPGGIRARIPSKRGTVDPHFRPRDHQDRRLMILSHQYLWTRKNYEVSRY